MDLKRIGKLKLVNLVHQAQRAGAIPAPVGAALHKVGDATLWIAGWKESWSHPHFLAALGSGKITVKVVSPGSVESVVAALRAVHDI